MPKAEFVERLDDQYRIVTDLLRRDGQEPLTKYRLPSEIIEDWRKNEELVAMLPTSDGAVRLGHRAHLAKFVLRDHPNMTGRTDMHWAHPFIAAYRHGPRTELGVGAELWRADARHVVDRKQTDALTIEPHNQMRLGALAIVTTIVDGEPAVLLRTSFLEQDVFEGSTHELTPREGQTRLDQAMTLLDAVEATYDRYAELAAA